MLIAGGRNKGLDLRPIAAAPTVRALVGIGEAAGELEASIDADRFNRAEDLDQAVAISDGLAVAGKDGEKCGRNASRNSIPSP